LRGNEIDISIIVRNAILEELYEEKEIDEKTYHKIFKPREEFTR